MTGFIIKTAFRNIFRHKLRTVVSIIAISFSVMIVVFARGYVTGLVDNSSSDIIQYNTGHIKIVVGEYRRTQRLLPLNYPVDGFEDTSLERMIKDLGEIEGVKMVIPRLKFGAMVSTEEELVGMMGWGINPQKEAQFTDVENFITAGRMVEPGRMEVVMGEELLDKLGRKPGDRVTVLFNTAFNSLNGATFEIVGSISSGIKLLDEVVFYLSMDEARRLLYMDGQVTELLIVGRDRKMVEDILPLVSEYLSEKDASGRYTALGYREGSSIMPFLDLAKTIYNGMYIFLVLLSSIVVVNTMIMIVKERTREIGMMTALGLKGGDILKLFLVEGGIMGVAGSLLGAVTGTLLNGYFSVKGINLSSAVSGFSTDYPFSWIIYTSSSIGNTVFAFCLGVVIVAAACLIPALRAAKLEPAEAIREI